MKTIEIKEDLYWIGGLDPTLEIFDIVMATEYGTTYNSYLVKGEKIAIVETVKEHFFEDFLAKISAVTDPAKIDYIIIDHTEPDHTGALRRLLEVAPHAEVICSRPASMYLREMLNREFRHRVVKDGDTLDLGQGKVLHFISAPLLHWPDSMYTYLPALKAIFTCDSFGCHYTEEDLVFEEQVKNQENFLAAQRYYFDVIMSPFSSYVLSAYEKVKNLDIDVICPGHGPILQEKPWETVERFCAWAREMQMVPEKVFIGYVSAYGYTRKMALTIGDELRKAGLPVTLLDLGESDITAINRAIRSARAILLGSPTINQDTVMPVWETLATVSPIMDRDKIAGAFGSFGWSGEAVDIITERMRGLKLQVVEPIKVKFIPSESQLEECRAFARTIARALQ